MRYRKEFVNIIFCFHEIKFFYNSFSRLIFNSAKKLGKNINVPT